ncbi:phosphosulfolactate synthase [Paenibacillus sp. UNCCL117]|uniref:phosphosulfolactate synthase n=1 Tax=unclassified Paenibacillus TaxID=185978 RepID=UPI00088CD94E|nr:MULTISPECIES: phosphosulfolactate synthase [unclassified Paenibacillus]SDD43749.1 phosphosulfolactate synthase [Paenibacillus sp. cl123]SFW47291.1 phosphosulfolactate synthase [Paenibacillus sp. UNCCL117]
MEVSTPLHWHPQLGDPSGQRTGKPRTTGKTMVIDKGLGLHALEDLLQTASSHMDMLKIGFGTSPLYDTALLRKKIEMAAAHDVIVYPGGTFLEVAIVQQSVDHYMDMLAYLGFTGIEISDGTIEVPRSLRSELIRRGVDAGLTVITEYGKKGWGSTIELEELIETVVIDSELGAELVTIEGRESGKGVGIYAEDGSCKDEELELVLAQVPSPELLLWEAPHKEQQVHLLKRLGAGIHLGNIAPADVVSLEALRRGLRSDTLALTKRDVPFTASVPQRPAASAASPVWFYQI